MNETRHKEPVSSRENFNIKESDFLSCVTQITSGMVSTREKNLVYNDNKQLHIIVYVGQLEVWI